MKAEAEAVLQKWIDLALFPPGQLAPDVRPAKWIAGQFLRWWRNDFEDHLDEWLGDAERALERIRSELNRLGGWEKYGEALHECSHLSDALASLRRALLPDDVA